MTHYTSRTSVYLVGGVSRQYQAVIYQVELWIRTLQGSRKLLKGKTFWLRGVDLNHRPLGYERQKQFRINLLAARVAAVGDYWDPKGSTKLYARVLQARAPQSQRTINQEEGADENECQSVQNSLRI